MNVEASVHGTGPEQARPTPVRQKGGTETPRRSDSDTDDDMLQSRQNEPDSSDDEELMREVNESRGMATSHSEPKRSRGSTARRSRSRAKAPCEYPSSKPPWVEDVSEQISDRTVQKFKGKLRKLKEGQNQLNEKLDRSEQQNKQMFEAQQKQISEQRAEIEALKEAIEEIRADRLGARHSAPPSVCPSSLGGSASNPYTYLGYDPELLVSGAWDLDTAKAVMRADLDKVIAAYNETTKSNIGIKEHRVTNGRGHISGWKLVDNAPSATSARALTYDIIAWHRELKDETKPKAVNGKVIWIVQDKKPEERKLGKFINRGLRVLHLVREKMGLPQYFEELGTQSKMVEGRYRGKTKGGRWMGKMVFTVEDTPEGHEIVWDWAELGRSEKPITQEALLEVANGLPPLGA